MKYVSHSSFPSFVLAYIPLDAPIASSALSNIVSYSIVNVFCGLSALLIGIVALAVALLPLADNFNDFVVSPVGIADVTCVDYPTYNIIRPTRYDYVKGYTESPSSVEYNNGDDMLAKERMTLMGQQRR